MISWSSMCLFRLYIFFYFKQKAAYEVRISDWSSACALPICCSFVVDGELRSVRPHGRFDCNDGAVLHEWALAGRGLAWRSMWEVSGALAAGRLRTVLQDFAEPPHGIYALFPEQLGRATCRGRVWQYV